MILIILSLKDELINFFKILSIFFLSMIYSKNIDKTLQLQYDYIIKEFKNQTITNWKPRYPPLKGLGKKQEQKSTRCLGKIGRQQMKTILVDDEPWALKQFEMELQEDSGIELVGNFSSAEKAYEYIQTHPVEFALLDVKMPKINGLELGQMLRKKFPQIIIVYVSSYPEFFADAYRNVRADYYMLKPYDQKDIAELLQRVRLLSKRQKKRVQFRTFGRFDMFADEQPVQFRNTKAKELLAICVDRKGGIVTMDEAIGKLWGDSPLNDNIKTRYRKAISYLHALMAEYHIPDVFISGYGYCYIDKTKVQCDYYDFLESGHKPHFPGQYMFEYSWAEETAAFLEIQAEIPLN